MNPRVRFAGWLLFFSLLALNVAAQDAEINWISKNAFALKKDLDSSADDLSFLSAILKNKTMLGLGEASHGTHEFFVQKARMISYLTRNCGFKILSIECPSVLMTPVNAYLQTGEGDLEKLLQPLALYDTRELYVLFQQLRQYNKEQEDIGKISVTGFDNEDLWGDPLARERSMAEHLLKAHEEKKHKVIVWAHNVHLVKDTTSGYQGLGYYLEQKLGQGVYSVGFDTYQGTVNVLNGSDFEEHAFKATEGQLSFTLGKVAYPSFFLPFKGAPFSGKTVLITNIYSDWREPKPLPIKPGLDFDALVFIKDTTASVELKWRAYGRSFQSFVLTAATINPLRVQVNLIYLIITTDMKRLIITILIASAYVVGYGQNYDVPQTKNRLCIGRIASGWILLLLGVS